MSSSDAPSSSAGFSKSQQQPPRKFIKRPDDEVVKKQIEALRKEIAQLDLASNELTAQLDKTTMDPKHAEARSELQTELRLLISKQSSLKTERNAVNDQIKQVDQSLKRKVAEIQAQTSKNSFKSVADIDARIDYLDGLVDAGTLKLAEERKFVKEMSSLRKLRKDFGAIEKQQALIDADKTKIAELKKKLSGLQNKEVQARFEEIQKKLDEINEQNKSVSTKRSEFVKKRAALREQKDAKFNAIRKLRADFDAEMDKFRATLAAERKKREEENKAREQEEKLQKKKEVAEKLLSEASVPAFTQEINSIHTLLAYFDPAYVKPAPKSTSTANGASEINTHKSIRKVEMPEDVVVLKKETVAFFEGTKGKKANRQRKNKTKFTVDPEVIAALGNLSIPLPTKSEDVEGTIEVLKETLKALEDKQEEQTKVNMERAKAQLAALEAEEEKKADEKETSEETTEEPSEEAAVEENGN
ncbi:uncharacterized protein KQ657_001019 [Scheffersomyces spartinae]|uniref:Nuclear segregation protein n=1 Tax=Scheffersomyces spartinae TaxID=45513 RepID=A0A9P7V8C7_9ASCO|nr:uncharacterized protein KQ657_001019 [Scheffersomyces spartinae]KAG7193256.1 hypothetical protein KQ657_001019 [Scheffersomyces spartinae]